MQEMQARSLSQEDPLEKETAIHSIILAWGIPWTEEPGRLQSMGLQESGATEQLSTYIPPLGPPYGPQARNGSVTQEGEVGLLLVQKVLRNLGVQGSQVHFTKIPISVLKVLLLPYQGSDLGGRYFPRGRVQPSLPLCPSHNSVLCSPLAVSILQLQKVKVSLNATKKLFYFSLFENCPSGSTTSTRR